MKMPLSIHSPPPLEDQVELRNIIVGSFSSPRVDRTQMHTYRGGGLNNIDCKAAYENVVRACHPMYR